MTIIAYPFDAVAGAPQYTGEMLRQTEAILFGPAPAGRPLGVTSGVRSGTPATTVSATSSTWTVAVHAGVLDLEASSTAGAYRYAVTVPETGAMTPADGTNQRVDSICLQLSDPAESDGTSAPAVAVIYTAGTPGVTGGARGAAGGPPNIPARSIELAQITVPKLGGGAPSTTWVANTYSPMGMQQTPDWNTAVTPGFYSTNSAGSTANSPASHSYVGVVYVDAAGNIIQIVRRPSLTSTAEEWQRTFSSATGNWNPWIQTWGDTGWLNLTGSLPSGWSASSLQARLLNGVVYLRGTITNGTYASGTLATVGNLPAAIPAPGQAMVFPQAQTASASVRYTNVTAGGAVQMANSNATGSPAFWHLDGASYPVG